jgi:C-terminal processing protease CtpA/Prc
MLLMGDEVWVEDVIENSPAALAGLKSGDEIMSINGDFSGNVQRYRSLIQQINTEIKMIVRRQENLVEVTFQPISIY